MKHYLLLLLFFSSSFFEIQAQEHSVARQWNEALLHAIRNDFARPTVHARNLFHSSMMMYDIWAAYDDRAEPFFLGKTVDGFTCPFDGVPRSTDVQAAREEAISYAMYKLLRHRFRNSPRAEVSFRAFEELFTAQGYDANFTSTDYAGGNPAAFGNFIAENVIEFGLQDGSNEQFDYANTFYRNYNFPIAPELSTNPFLWDPNRWQPLTFEVFIDQSGNEIPGGAPPFLSPEWGLVTPFALEENDLTIYQRDGHDWWVYNDPGAPPYIQPETGGTSTEQYQWGFTMVSLWSAHLDPTDGVMWDISPGAIGNTSIDDFPTDYADYPNFYNAIDGGDIGTGHAINPKTGEPYPTQIVPRGDYTRVLAEFWADGPDSETPPGHWFTILNYVNDHPQFEKKFKGEGELLDDLEWDVKAYFTLGGAVHDAAIAAWGVKGWYDYLRPISAIRYMAERGQSSNSELPNYDIGGIPLYEGLVELIEEGDPLAGVNNEFVGQIKLYAWKGPDYIGDPETSQAGVGWILASQWWPYQRPTFVTPPFAGYVSGHSTFSRAASEILTQLTGDPYFPGGVGEFVAKKNEFLVFEEGPSQDIVLQWATYRDASDQTSLSRIWGGIHPPVDDIPGRLMGEKVGYQSFAKAESYFNVLSTSTEEVVAEPTISAFPNPMRKGELLTIRGDFNNETVLVELFDLSGKRLVAKQVGSFADKLALGFSELTGGEGLFTLKITGETFQANQKLVMMK
ncbi:MAG: DUF6851 domain-containing protein [Bacteroidota bacterium]